MIETTLYHCVGARSLRPLWVLEELGLPYQLQMLAFPPRAHQREYLAINPLGTVPAMLSDGQLMTESVAMCQYLVAQHGPTPLAVDPSEADFASYLNYLYFGEATLTFPQTLVLRYQHFEPPQRQVPQVAQDYAKWFLARLRVLEARLAGRDYLCADRFTTADVSVGYALLLAQYVGLLEQAGPVVQAYWQRLSQRPAYLRALQAERAAALAQGISPDPAPALRPWE
ncbi:MAG: glutathione S-transferase family protein [Burkholderiaceae bacterium]|nr:glutathione S-transferase family protein [Burkholderiaceae bacterium]